MKIDGLEELLKILTGSNKRFDGEAQKSVNKLGNKLLRKTKLKTPVDSGALRRSWQGQKGVLSYTVSNNLHYASHQEHGFRHYKSSKVVDGRYMLTKSVKEIEQEMDAEFEALIENLWE